MNQERLDSSESTHVANFTDENVSSPVDDVVPVHVLALCDEIDLLQSGVAVLVVVAHVDLDPPVVVVAVRVGELHAACLRVVLCPVMDLFLGSFCKTCAMLHHLGLEKGAALAVDLRCIRCCVWLT